MGTVIARGLKHHNPPDNDGKCGAVLVEHSRKRGKQPAAQLARTTRKKLTLFAYTQSPSPC